jgi:hypothetical protein
VKAQPKRRNCPPRPATDHSHPKPCQAPRASRNTQTPYKH